MLIVELPFTMMIAGPSACGKTSLVLELLKHIKGIGKILWCNMERNAVPLTAIQNCDIEISEHIPSTFENVKDGTLIVLDDLMTEAYNKTICELFTKGSHHRNISVILITQNVFHQGKFCRDISLNCKYLVVFKNPRDKSQIYPLARQIYPENVSEFVKVYKQATSKPHGYLFMDLTQSCNDLIRFRTDIFNSEYVICYAAENLLRILEKNESIEGEQTYVTCIKNVQTQST